MSFLEQNVLRRLGAVEAIDSVCQAAGWTRDEFDDRWKREAESRVPPCDGQVVAGVQAAVSIERDHWGIPHIFAETARDQRRGISPDRGPLDEPPVGRRCRKPIGASRFAELLGSIRSVALGRVSCLAARSRSRRGIGDATIANRSVQLIAIEFDFPRS
jgi:hypothetical protein